MNRRDFLKKSAITGGLVAGVTVTSQLTNPLKVEASGFGVKYHNTIDDVITISKDYKRYPQKDSAFLKSVLDDFGIMPLKESDNPKLKHAFINYTTAWMGKNPYTGELNPHFGENKPGFTQLDYAFSRGGIGTEDYTGSYFARLASGDSGPAITGPDGSLIPTSLYNPHVPFPGVFEVAPTKYKFKSNEEGAFAVKKAGKKLGADLVGIAPYDERWTYDTEVYLPINPMTQAPYADKLDIERKVDFGFEPKSVIVMAFEMDYEGYKTSPSEIMDAVTSVKYSKMMETSLRVAYFIRALGYNAVHAGNNIGLSVPIAIQAGLGEGSRMGMMITEEYGPRVRLAKVYTDLEIQYDKPKTFGVFEFCEVCQRCADSCPSGCISKVKSPGDAENKPQNESNNPGVRKWFNDGQKCVAYWGESRAACGNCISVCPYNKIEGWHHNLAKVATKIPGINRFTRLMDEMFGYGNEFDEEMMRAFWKRQL